MTTNVDLIDDATAQFGKPYVYATQPDPSVPNPRSFCCSGYTRWVAGRNGAYLPAGSWIQWQFCLSRGTTISLAQAARTPMALLFMPEDPSRGQGPNGHVGFSMGDGVHTLEARGSAWGIGSWGIGGRPWSSHAALIPGVAYTGSASPSEFVPKPKRAGKVTMRNVKSNEGGDYWIDDGMVITPATALKLAAGGAAWATANELELERGLAGANPATGQPASALAPRIVAAMRGHVDVSGAVRGEFASDQGEDTRQAVHDLTWWGMQDAIRNDPAIRAELEAIVGDALAKR